MRAFIRKTEIRAGYDCVPGRGQCPHNVSGDHGIHGEEIVHALMTELDDGRRAAISVRIYTDHFPSTVPMSTMREAPRTAGIEVHVQTNGHGTCGFLGGVPCEVVHDLASGGDDLQPHLGSVRDPVTGYQPHTWQLLELARKPVEDFWIALERKFRTFLDDPTYFPQLDESPHMADLRTARDQAMEAFRAATTRVQDTQKAFQEAIDRYRLADPAYRVGR